MCAHADLVVVVGVGTPEKARARARQKQHGRRRRRPSHTHTPITCRTFRAGVFFGKFFFIHTYIRLYIFSREKLSSTVRAHKPFPVPCDSRTNLLYRKQLIHAVFGPYVEENRTEIIIVITNIYIYIYRRFARSCTRTDDTRTRLYSSRFFTVVAFDESR